jgi:hypothetical protein
MLRPKMSFPIEELHCAVDALIRNHNATASDFESSAELADAFYKDFYLQNAELFRQHSDKAQKLLDRLEAAWEESETLEVS